MSYLRNIGVSNWEPLEPYLIGAIIARANVMLIGPPGTGKTYAWMRIASALKMAHEQEGQEFLTRIIDAPNLNEEDLIGFPYPDADKIRVSKEEGVPYYMERILSPQSIAHARAILIDEATRIPPFMQGRFYNLLTDNPVDGHKVPYEFIWGTSNPPHYPGVQKVDYAYADRWALVVQPPKFEDFDMDHKLEVMSGAFVSDGAHPIDMESAKVLLDIINKGRNSYEDIGKALRDRVTRYIIATGNMTWWKQKGADPKEPHMFNTRRLKQVVRVLIGTTAFRRLTGSSVSLADDMINILRYSNIGPLLQKSNEDIIEKTKEVHAINAHMLYDGGDAEAISLVLSEHYMPKRIAILLDPKLKFGAATRGLHYQQALESLREESEKRHEPERYYAFIWTLCNLFSDKMDILPISSLATTVGALEIIGTNRGRLWSGYDHSPQVDTSKLIGYILKAGREDPYARGSFEVASAVFKPDKTGKTPNHVRSGNNLENVITLADKSLKLILGYEELIKGQS